MEPSCSQSSCSFYDGSNTIPFESKVEIKTENKASILETNEEEITPNNVLIKSETIDELEREDYEEENRIIKHCSETIEAGKLAKSPQFLGNLSSANSSLASSSETISTLSNPNERIFSLPGCSKGEDFEDSKAGLKNILHLNFSYSNMNSAEDAAKLEPPRAQTVVFKDDFMKTLLGTGPNTGDFEEKMYKEGKCDIIGTESNLLFDKTKGPSSRTSSNASSIGSTSSDLHKDTFTVASTSNAEKLLGLCGSTSDSLKSPSYVNYGDEEEESEDDDNEASWCTCMMTHEDEPDDIPDFQSWFHRKRTNTYGAFNSLPAAKRVCNRDATPASSSRIAVNPISQNSVINHTAARPPHINQWLSRFQQWSKVEQTEALISLIDNCNAGQVRYMMRAIEPMFQRDFISLLPKELALNVLRYLEPKDLLRAAQTCTAWRVLADDHLLWKEQCARIGLDTHKKPRTVSHTSPWKAAYMRQYMIESNWLNKPVDEPKRMPGHEDHVITCLQFHGNRILSGSDDTTLRVWCASNGKLLRILKGHTGGVWSSQMVGDLVISGSTDRTLRVWDAKTGACLKVLYGHTSTVRCMHIHDTSVVSGSRDATLRVWSIPDGRCLQVLVGHLAAVRCVQFDGKVVVSGAYDFFVKVWDPVNGACLHTLAGHTNRVYSLQFDGVHVVSGSLDTSIRVWDVETGRLKHTLIGHQSLTSGMELRNNILVSGNADSTVKVWDINTGQCLHTLSGPNKHQSAVTCLQTSNRFVITSSDDGTVKLWDVNSGEFIRDLVKLDSGGSGGVVWRIRASATKLICAVGSRNGTEETKLLVLDFDVPGACAMCDQ